LKERRMSAMHKGKVKFFSDEKGYGFIKCEDFAKDVFVHHTEIQMQGRRKLETDQEVQFQVREDEKGVKATNVVPLGVQQSA